MTDFEKFLKEEISIGPERRRKLIEYLKKPERHMIEALRWIASQPCDTENCGTVCLCPPCHARKALAFYDPEWNP